MPASVEARKRVPMFTPWAPENERGRQPASVGDASRREHRQRRDGCGDLRHEGERSDRGAEPARLAALRDDHVHAALGCRVRLLHRVHLLDEDRTDGVRSVHEVARIAEREGHHRGLTGERGRVRVVGERPRREVDRERTVGELADAFDEARDLVGAMQRRPDRAEPARLRYSRGQPAFVQGPIEPCITGTSIPRTSQTGVRTRPMLDRVGRVASLVGDERERHSTLGDVRVAGGLHEGAAVPVREARVALDLSVDLP